MISPSSILTHHTMPCIVLTPGSSCNGLPVPPIQQSVHIRGLGCVHRGVLIS